MKKIENRCVDCGMPCLSSCRLRNVNVCYCDRCKDDNAIYTINDEDLCEHCADTVLNELFDELTISEKAEALNLTLHEVDGDDFREGL